MVPLKHLSEDNVEEISFVLSQKYLIQIIHTCFPAVKVEGEPHMKKNQFTKL